MKRWRDPCAKCAKAPFMLCITCEHMNMNRTVSIKLKPKPKKVKVRVPKVFSAIGR